MRDIWFDNIISGPVFEQPDHAEQIWASYVEIGVHGYFRLGRVRRFDRIYFVKSPVSNFCTDPTAHRMLRKEFEALASLDHPNIVRVLDMYDNTPLGPAILMEYVQGRTLSEFLAEKPSRFLRKKVANMLLDGMIYAHSRGIAHRDIKPENMLVTHVSNNLKIIDFGMCDFSGAAVLKRVGGNRQYSAPEILEGKPSDTRADVYSISRLLTELKPGRFWRRGINKGLAENPSQRCNDATQLQQAIRSGIRLMRCNHPK